VRQRRLVNAVVRAHGLAVGGREEAQNAMRLFWKRMSETTSHGTLQQSWIDMMIGKFGLEHSPGYLFTDALMYFTSPYLYNPLNQNPIRNVLEEILHFDRLRRQPVIKLFLHRKGQGVFKSKEIGANHVASGEAGMSKRAGGFAGSPVIFPLVCATNVPISRGRRRSLLGWST
jgi:NTE family protein